jgi:hypothetical protein
MDMLLNLESNRRLHHSMLRLAGRIYSRINDNTVSDRQRLKSSFVFDHSEFTKIEDNKEANEEFISRLSECAFGSSF